MHTIPNCSYFQSNRKLNAALEYKIIILQIFVQYIQINCLIVLKQRKLKYDPLHLVRGLIHKKAAVTTHSPVTNISKSWSPIKKSFIQV